MTRILVAALSIVISIPGSVAAADAAKIRSFIADNIYWDSGNPIFQEENDALMTSFRDTLMNPSSAARPASVEPALKDLYGVLGEQVSDEPEGRRWCSRLAVCFARLALLAHAQDDHYLDRSRELVQYAEQAMDKCTDRPPDLMAGNRIAVLVLEYYVTGRFRYDEIKTHLPELARVEQNRFTELFKDEIARSRKQ